MDISYTNLHMYHDIKISRYCIWLKETYITVVYGALDKIKVFQMLL